MSIGADITKLCVRFDWANDGCKLCPLQHACNAVINEKKVTDRTAIWERGMAEAYEKYMMENMTEEA